MIQGIISKVIIIIGISKLGLIGMREVFQPYYQKRRDVGSVIYLYIYHLMTFKHEVPP